MDAQQIKPKPQIRLSEWYLNSIDNDNAVVNDENGFLFESPDEETAKAICNAVNNTYGKGINPESIPDLQKQLTQLKELNAELLGALKEVVRISDRKHDVWDKAKEVIVKAETGQPLKYIQKGNESEYLALEFGYIQCEKGNNIQMAFSNYEKVKSGQ